MIPVQAIGLNDRVTQYFLDAGVPFAGSLASLLTFVVGFLVMYLLGRSLAVPIVSRGLASRDVSKRARQPLVRITKVLVGFLAVGLAFGLAGFGNLLTSLSTIAAAATLAIGFALQDLIRNLVAGVFIFTGQAFRIGDWIEWDQHEGIVEDISFRVTRVRTFDNEVLTVPNAQLTNDVTKNPVARGKLRLKPKFEIHYDDDIGQATEVALEEAQAHPEIMDDPEPSVRLAELADSYVVLESRIWIEDPERADFVRIRGEYMTAVKESFDEVDITIPFPQRTLSGGVDVESEPTEAR